MLTPRPRPTSQQKRHKTPDKFLQIQPHLNAKMRIILLDWILDVQQCLGYRSQTFYITAFLIDKVRACYLICLPA